MKTIIQLTVKLFIICLLFSNCKKSSPGTNTTIPTGSQTPVQTAVQNLTRSEYGAQESYMNGIELHFTQAGTVTQLGMASATPGTWAVALYDSASQTLLGTVNVNVIDTGKFFYVTLPAPISVTAGVEYGLAYYNNYTTEVMHYNYQNSVGSDLYPLTAGSVVLDDQLETIGEGTVSYPFTNLVHQPTYLNSIDLVFVPGN